MDYQRMEQAAREAGFAHMAPVDPATIELKPEVRQMCRSCHMYDTRWSCPPGCGTLEENAARIQQFRQGILLQTVGQLEDEFDGEGMMEAQQCHKENFQAFCSSIAEKTPVLALGAGCCTVCSKCTYPESACRFPEKMISSMEAYGMVVSEVCQKAGQPYYYGKNTIAYTSCLLFDQKPTCGGDDSSL